MNRRQAFGNSFPKRWELCYPNLTEYIINLHIKENHQIVKQFITINKKYHNESTALERSVMNGLGMRGVCVCVCVCVCVYWGGGDGGGGR